MKVSTQPEPDNRPTNSKTDADGNIVGTPEYGYGQDGYIDEEGNFTPVSDSETPRTPTIEEWKNWRSNWLMSRMLGIAKGVLGRRSDQTAQIAWTDKFVQIAIRGISELFPKRRGRPQQYEDGAARARAFRKRKSEAKSAEQLMEEIIKAYDENRDAKGRGRGENHSGGCSVMDLQEKEFDSPLLGPRDNSFGPVLGGSYLQKNPDTIGDRRRNTFDPDTNKIKTGYESVEPNESESKFVRRQNWSINLTPTKEEKQQIVQDCIEELADNNSFEVSWCPWPQELDYGLIYAPDNSGKLIPREDEIYGHQMATRCSMQMSDGNQCTFCSGADHIDDERGPLLQRNEILNHIEQAHRKEWRELLKAKLPAPVKKCTKEDHTRLRLQGVMNKERSRLYCGRCGKQVYDPARNHPDPAIRREYEEPRRSSE